NVNATFLQSRAIASLAPSSGQVLTWNVTNSDWEPQAIPVNAITELYGDVVASGLGDVNATIPANTITSSKINNSGNSANRILITDGVSGSTVTYATCAQNEILRYDTTTGWGCASSTSGSVTSIVSGTGLIGNTITSAGTLNVDVGTTANKILQLNASAQIPVVDGSLLTNVNATKLQSRIIASAAPSDQQVLRWNATSSQWEPSADTSGTLTQITASTGLLGGTITSNGTISVDVGTTASKIVQLTAGAQYPAVDGNLITNINAVKLQSRDVANTAPASGQVLGWNGTSSQWEPISAAVGSVTGVVSGTGLIGTTITSSGTINVDTGTTASKIVQLTAGAQYPAVDGNLITNVNAAKLQSRDVANTAPSTGQVLGWNSTTSQWEPTTASTGSVQDVEAGTGLLGGPITSNGTLSVDVGTTANKILQLNGSAQIPTVDGSLLTNVNATKLQSRTIASAAPSDNQVLRWNATSSQWEPSTDTTGTLTQITASTGLLGGTITSNGTISVDVGTTASKIVQL